MQPLEILLVEDVPSQVRLAEDAFGGSKRACRLHTVSSPMEAMDFLHAAGAYQGAPRPSLILLTLQLPQLDGREVLAVIKEDEDLRRIPVVVLTTGKSEGEVMKAYGLHANCCISQPLSAEQYAEAVRNLETFWFSVATLVVEA